jgi:hypothetical protein
MTSTELLVRRLGTLLGADTVTLAPAALAVHVHLVIAPFTPGLDTDIAALTLATFTGSAPKDAGVGPQTVYVDPTTGNQRVQLIEPLGGWNWICTADPAAEEPVYGYVVTDNADSVTFGSGLVANAPVVIDEAGQGVNVGSIEVEIPISALQD